MHDVGRGVSIPDTLRMVTHVWDKVCCCPFFSKATEDSFFVTLAFAMSLAARRTFLSQVPQGSNRRYPVCVW